MVILYCPYWTNTINLKRKNLSILYDSPYPLWKTHKFFPGAAGRTAPRALQNNALHRTVERASETTSTKRVIARQKRKPSLRFGFLFSELVSSFSKPQTLRWFAVWFLGKSSRDGVGADAHIGPLGTIGFAEGFRVSDVHSAGPMCTRKGQTASVRQHSCRRLRSASAPTGGLRLYGQYFSHSMAFSTLRSLFCCEWMAI